MTLMDGAVISIDCNLSKGVQINKTWEINIEQK